MTGIENRAAIFAALVSRGLEEIEIFCKRGRSRRFEVGVTGKAGISSVEGGWAIRAGTSRSSLFVAGTGSPDAKSVWPEPDGQPLRLPAAITVPDWRPPADLDSALVGESEAMALLAGIESALASEIPDGRLLRGVLEEGTSETTIDSNRDIAVSYRSRAASLVVEAVGPWPGSASVVLSLAARDHRDFHPPAIASRLANRLVLSRGGTDVARERGDVLLSPAVGAVVLASLRPLFVGPQAAELIGRLQDRQGRLGNPRLTVIDDGRLPGGVLEAPVDGEGMPTGPVVLIEEGTFRQSLVDWRFEAAGSPPVRGWARRESWRDLPATAPSHLYLQPQDEVSVADLVGAVSRGFYLLEPAGPGQFDFAEDRFRLPVCGFELRQGKATAPVSRVWLEGTIGALLRNVQAVARDLEFYPLAGMIGAPTTLVTGLGLRSID